MTKPLDFTRPHLRGKRVIPRKGDTPPQLVSNIKIVKMKDLKTGEPLSDDPQIILGPPGKVDHRIKLNDEQDKS